MEEKEQQIAYEYECGTPNPEDLPSRMSACMSAWTKTNRQERPELEREKREGRKREGEKKKNTEKWTKKEKVYKRNLQGE